MGLGCTAQQSGNTWSRDVYGFICSNSSSLNLASEQTQNTDAACEQVTSHQNKRAAGSESVRECKLLLLADHCTMSTNRTEA